MRRGLAAWYETISGALGLVITTGASHEGHLGLVWAAQDFADTVLVTVLVNPAQSAPNEDFETYPRNLGGDTKKLCQEGVGALFVPTPEVMYPEDKVRVRLGPGLAAETLEEKTRPTHFVGILLAVGKMLHPTRPDIVCSGRKDAQQLAIATQVMEDLDPSVQVVPVKICHGKDGSAMNSRNRYLSTTRHETALELSYSLQWGMENVKEYDPQALASAVHERPAAVPGIEVDYVALIDSEGYVPIIQADYHEKTILAPAARVESTGLIDNIGLWT